MYIVLEKRLGYDYALNNIEMRIIQNTQNSSRQKCSSKRLDFCKGKVRYLICSSSTTSKYFQKLFYLTSYRRYLFDLSISQINLTEKFFCEKSLSRLKTAKRGPF